MFFLLLLLGLATYFIVKRSVAGITQTPVWILWLVMMTPALVWNGWLLVYGASRPMPTALLIVLFAVCMFLYLWLIQLGRPKTKPSGNNGSEPSASPETASPEAGKTPRPIDKEEEATLRNCFPWSIFYLQNLDFRPQAVICRGQLRSQPDVAYQTIRDNIESKFGDRFLIIFQEDLNGSPFFALVANPQSHPEAKRRNQTLTRPGLALGLVVSTLFTTTLFGAGIAGVTPEAVESNPVALLNGLPYGLAIMTILGIHEMGHYLTARFYQIRTTLPYFIPVPFFIGTLGAFIQMRSLPPHRKALFDVSIAGPLAGFIVTLPLLIWGLAHSALVPLSDKSGLLNFNALDPSFSLLLALLSKLALGNALTSTQAIDLHPVAVAGYIGLIVTALNLMPVGQLDGGHIVHAMFGQRQATVIGQVARTLLLIAALMPWIVGVSIIPRDFLLWAFLLFLMPIIDEPALNDISELDNRRDLLGLLALGLLIIIILPAPPFINQLLNI